MSNESAPPPSIGEFRRRRLITEVLDTVKSGKEATVWRCRAHPSTGRTWLAAKVHRPMETRAFRHDHVYMQGRAGMQTRVARAIAGRTAFGEQARSLHWAEHEFLTLRRLRRLGARVPEAVALEDRIVLLEWLGDDDPAPQLLRVRLPRDEAQRCRDALLREVAIWLAADLVHGDLSPFNVLWHDGAPVVIDWPQAVDPRANPDARMLLARDLGNLAKYFAAVGAGFDAEALADRLWQRWHRAELVGDATDLAP